MRFNFGPQSTFHSESSLFLLIWLVRSYFVMFGNWAYSRPFNRLWAFTHSPKPNSVLWWWCLTSLFCFLSHFSPRKHRHQSWPVSLVRLQTPILNRTPPAVLAIIHWFQNLSSFNLIETSLVVPTCLVCIPQTLSLFSLSIGSSLFWHSFVSQHASRGACKVGFQFLPRTLPYKAQICSTLEYFDYV